MVISLSLGFVSPDHLILGVDSGFFISVDTLPSSIPTGVALYAKVVGYLRLVGSPISFYASFRLSRLFDFNPNTLP